MELFTKLPKEQIPDLAQQAKAIGGLSKAERGGVLGAIANYPVGALKFLKENPGLLYSTVGLTAFYAFIDTLGKAVPVKQYINLAFLIPLVALGVWFGIKLWGTWQAKKIDLENRKST